MTIAQVAAIVALLFAFGVDPATVNNVETILKAPSQVQQITQQSGGLGTEPIGSQPLGSVSTPVATPTASPNQVSAPILSYTSEPTWTLVSSEGRGIYSLDFSTSVDVDASATITLQNGGGHTYDLGHGTKFSYVFDYNQNSLNNWTWKVNIKNLTRSGKIPSFLSKEN